MACVDWMRRWVSVARARSAAVSWTRIWASECSSFSFRSCASFACARVRLVFEGESDSRLWGKFSA